MVSLTTATTAPNQKQEMTDYKKYSLENLENWIHDVISSGDATPREIYDVIIGVVKESHDYHKEQADQAGELLNLLNGQRTLDIDMSEFLREREYYEQSNMTNQELSQYKVSLSCDKDDPSPECQGAWNDFWEDVNNWSEESKLHITEDGDIYPVKDKVVKWQLPVQVDGLTGECFINLPDDLLERARLKEGDTVEWIDRNDGSFELRKTNGIK